MLFRASWVCFEVLLLLHVLVSGASAAPDELPSLPVGEGGTGLNPENECSTRLFPTNCSVSEWTQFPASGFSNAACGVVYRLHTPVANGVPIGGIDTGCFDLETTGLLGYATIFNTHVPRRGPINLPFLGLSVGGTTWVLCDPSKTKKYEASDVQATVEPYPLKLDLEGVKTVNDIVYWGHYPVADLEFETDAPVLVGLRAWAPFVPGDVVSSTIPGAIFEVHLRNRTKENCSGTLAYSFPGPSTREAGSDDFSHSTIKTVASRNQYKGILTKSPKSSYLLAVLNQDQARFGGELGAKGACWAEMKERLPELKASEGGSSVAVDFELNSGESKVIRFLLAWHSPKWKGGGHPSAPSGNIFTHMYAKFHPSVEEAAKALAANHQALLRRVLAWQEVIYADDSLPTWLRDSLINYLYLLTEDGMWAQAVPPLDPAFQEGDGLFGLNECPRGCPQIECIPCSFYGNIPLVYLFPQLALSTLRGYKVYQRENGAPPWIFGGFTAGTPPIEFTMPCLGYQVTMNSACYIDMLDRYLMCYDKDKSLLKEFYSSAKRSTLFTMELNKSPYGVVAMPDRKVSEIGIPWESQWYEWYYWWGVATHVGGVHLAQLRMNERMARDAGDELFAEQCRTWFQSGISILEGKMWADGYYLNLWNPETGEKSDHIFSNQLDGEWMALFHGLPAIFKPDRVKRTLQTIREKNVPPTKYGAINFVRSDGSVLASGEFPMSGNYKPYDFFSPELYMLAMTYIYHGEREFGLELARRCTHNIVCEQRMHWDMPTIILGDTGKRNYGNDYYQNLMIWSFPAVLAGRDLTQPLEQEGLVRRVIDAAK